MITVSARRLGDRLILQVTDDGPGLNAGPNNRVSVGLSNTRQRLAQMYGNAQSCELRNRDVSGAVATITLPFHVSSASDAAVVA
jgi:signal transduction histidine kinase